jgi:hypothetical protein
MSSLNLTTSPLGQYPTFSTNTEDESLDQEYELIEAPLSPKDTPKDTPKSIQTVFSKQIYPNNQESIQPPSYTYVQSSSSSSSNLTSMPSHSSTTYPFIRPEPSPSYTYYQSPSSSSLNLTSMPSQPYSSTTYPSVELLPPYTYYQAPPSLNSDSTFAPPSRLDSSNTSPHPSAPFAGLLENNHLVSSSKFLPTKAIPPYHAPEETRQDGRLIRGAKYLGSFFSRPVYATSLEIFRKAIREEDDDLVQKSTICHFVDGVSKIISRKAPLQEKIKLFSEAIESALPYLPLKREPFLYSLENQLRSSFYNKILQDESAFAHDIFWKWIDRNPNEIITPVIQVKSALTRLRLGQSGNMRGEISCNPEYDLYWRIFEPKSDADLLMELIPPMRELQEAYAKLDADKLILSKELLPAYELRWQCWARVLEVLTKLPFKKGFSQGKPIPRSEWCNSKPTLDESESLREGYPETKERHKSDAIGGTPFLNDPSVPSRSPIRKEVVSLDSDPLDSDEASHEHYIDVMVAMRPIVMEGDWFKELPAGVRYRIYKLYLEGSANNLVKDYETYKSEYAKNSNEFTEMCLIRERFINPMIRTYPREIMEPLMNVIYAIEARRDLQDTYSLVRSIPGYFFKRIDFFKYVECLKNKFQFENSETDKSSKILSNKKKNILVHAILWWFDDQISKIEKEKAIDL